jgi:hypothetical protein
VTNGTDTTGTTHTKKVTTTVTSVTTSPAQTNQFEHANWSVGAGLQATMTTFQLYAVMAIFVPIYRITNDVDSVEVDVLTDQQDGVHAPGKFQLQPGTSIDLSWENISIKNSSAKIAHGTYQYLNSALASQQVQQQPAKAVAPASPGATPAVTSGPKPGEPFDPITFPDPNPVPNPNPPPDPNPPAPGPGPSVAPEDGG